MEYLKGIPDILYKYRDWKDEYHKKVITENELFLASRQRFNDPFDSSIPYRYNDAELTPDNIFLKLREIEKKLYPHLSESQIINRCYEIQKTDRFTSGKYWKDDYDEYLAAVDARFGILSLTTKRDNLLMWSHYSNSHKGYCIGFDKKFCLSYLKGHLKESIIQEKCPSSQCLMKVGSVQILFYLQNQVNGNMRMNTELQNILQPIQSINFPTRLLKKSF